MYLDLSMINNYILAQYKYKFSQSPSANSLKEWSVGRYVALLCLDFYRASSLKEWFVGRYVALLCLDFYRASSLKEWSVGRYVALLCLDFYRARIFLFNKHTHLYRGQRCMCYKYFDLGSQLSLSLFSNHLFSVKFVV
jgi:hypothetical protein